MNRGLAVGLLMLGAMTVPLHLDLLVRGIDSVYAKLFLRLMAGF